MKTLLLSAALLTACRSPDSHTPSPPTTETDQTQVMRTYQVPPGHQKDVERLLRGNHYPVTVIGGDKAVLQTQFVRLEPQFTGDGYFVLSAPVGIQEGVKQLLEELKSHPAMTGPTSIETTYWMVLGFPSAKTEIPDSLAAITPALKGISDLGTMRFEPYETVQLSSLDGDEARATASRAEVRQTASADKDGFDIRLEIKVYGADTNGIIDTSVRVKSGQFAVLGEAGFKLQNAGLTDPRPTLFYVVRTRPAA